jgi:hypothetical protein
MHTHAHIHRLLSTANIVDVQAESHVDPVQPALTATSAATAPASAHTPAVATPADADRSAATPSSSAAKSTTPTACGDPSSSAVDKEEVVMAALLRKHKMRHRYTPYSADLPFELSNDMSRNAARLRHGGHTTGEVASACIAYLQAMKWATIADMRLRDGACETFSAFIMSPRQRVMAALPDVGGPGGIIAVDDTHGATSDKVLKMFAFVVLHPNKDLHIPLAFALRAPCKQTEGDEYAGHKTTCITEYLHLYAEAAHGYPMLMLVDRDFASINGAMHACIKDALAFFDGIALDAPLREYLLKMNMQGRQQHDHAEVDALLTNVAGLVDGVQLRSDDQLAELMTKWKHLVDVGLVDKDTLRALLSHADGDTIVDKFVWRFASLYGHIDAELRHGRVKTWVALETEMLKLAPFRHFVSTDGPFYALVFDIAQRRVRLCWFHVKKAVLEHANRCYGHRRDAVQGAMAIFTAWRDQPTKERFHTYWHEHSAGLQPSFRNYLDTYWLRHAMLWAGYARNFSMCKTHTTNAVESFFGNLKNTVKGRYGIDVPLLLQRLIGLPAPVMEVIEHMEVVRSPDEADPADAAPPACVDDVSTAGGVPSGAHTLHGDGAEGSTRTTLPEEAPCTDVDTMAEFEDARADSPSDTVVDAYLAHLREGTLGTTTHAVDDGFEDANSLIRYMHAQLVVDRVQRRRASRTYAKVGDVRARVQNYINMFKQERDAGDAGDGALDDDDEHDDDAHAGAHDVIPWCTALADPTVYRVRSQGTRPGRTYIVSVRCSTCTCPDRPLGSYCKHVLAARYYRLFVEHKPACWYDRELQFVLGNAYGDLDDHHHQQQQLAVASGRRSAPQRIAPRDMQSELDAETPGLKLQFDNVCAEIGEMHAQGSVAEAATYMRATVDLFHMMRNGVGFAIHGAIEPFARGRGSHLQKGSMDHHSRRRYGAGNALPCIPSNIKGYVLPGAGSSSSLDVEPGSPSKRLRTGAAPSGGRPSDGRPQRANRGQNARLDGFDLSSSGCKHGCGESDCRGSCRGPDKGLG